MGRYVFHLPTSLDAKQVSAAKKTAAAMGATVVRTAPGQMLVEASEAKAAELADELPQWRYGPDRASARRPDLSPLTRAKFAAAR